MPEVTLPQLPANPDRQLLKQVRAHFSVHRYQGPGVRRLAGSRLKFVTGGRVGEDRLDRVATAGPDAQDLAAVRPAIQDDLLDRDDVLRLAALRHLELPMAPPHPPEPARHDAQDKENRRRDDPQDLDPQRRVPETLNSQDKAPKVGHVRCPLHKKRGAASTTSEADEFVLWPRNPHTWDISSGRLTRSVTEPRTQIGARVYRSSGGDLGEKHIRINT